MIHPFLKSRARSSLPWPRSPACPRRKSSPVSAARTACQSPLSPPSSSPPPQVVHTSSGLLEPERQESLARRVRVWPRFTVYIATFVASQLPTAPFLVLAVYRDAYDEPFPRGLRTFGTVANVLSQAHGLLNALVFVATNRSVYRQCRGHELLASSSSWSDAWARGPSALLCCCALGRDTPPVLDRASSAFSTEPARSHDPLGLLMDQDAWADAE